MILLAADIGGTKTILKTAQLDDAGHLTPLHEQRFASRDFPQFEEMLHAFIAAHPEPPRIVSACIGLAGPIDGNQAKVTNLPWVLLADKIAAEFNIKNMQLINDFVAIGYGVPELTQHDLLTLQAGKPRDHGSKAILGAGTGLGEALLHWCGQHYQVLPTEGGHSHFAPINALQIELLQYLLKKYDRVSNERLLSGQGIANLFEFLQYSRDVPINADLHKAMQHDDPATAISAFALDQKDETAVACMQLFGEIYAQCAGDLALTNLAYGGVYLAGGIAVKNQAFLAQDNFLQAFNNKGRMTLMMTKMPVHLILNPKVGLIGAMQAARLLHQSKTKI